MSKEERKAYEQGRIAAKKAMEDQKKRELETKKGQAWTKGWKEVFKG